MVTYTDRKWGPVLFVPRDGSFTAQVGEFPPGSDPTDPNVFLAWANPVHTVRGWWWTGTKNIADIVRDPNAYNIRLKGFSYTKKVNWGGPLPHDTISFLDDIDGAQFSVDLEGTENGVAQDRTQILNQILSPQGRIKFGLFQYASAGIESWIEQRLWNYSVSGLYDTTTPPVPRTLMVKVYDAAGATPIKGATASLLSDITIVDKQTTDDDGIAILNGFNQIYQLKVYAENYVPYPFIANIDLFSGNASIDAPLNYVESPPFELPWWWPIPVAGVGLVATYLILKRVLR